MSEENLENICHETEPVVGVGHITCGGNYVVCGDNYAVGGNNYAYGSGGVFSSRRSLLSDVEVMCNTLASIKKLYTMIDVQDTDIFLTMADTGETLSMNKVIGEWREYKKTLSPN